MSILFDAHEDPTSGTVEHDQQTKKARARNQQDPSQQSASNKFADILIFGYHCKLFRDDQAADDVNNGKFLIPWMGNKDLMIDRYDCRGHLYRIEEFDFENMGAFAPLSPDRLDVENVCDEERYMDLNKDMSEESILQEEEDKRGSALYDPFTAYQNIEYSYEDSSEGKKLSDVGASSSSNSTPSFDNGMYIQFCQYYGYDSNDENLKAYFQNQQGQVAYQYDYERPPPPSDPPPEQDVSEPASISATAVPAAETYERFKPPEGIEFPDGMEMPETRKMQQIIDKTAMFISTQSAQMEIVLKTKQSGNPQFAFLEFDNFLNPYYKFMLGKIKSGEYEYIDTKASDISESTSKEEVTAKGETKDEAEIENENDSDDEEGDGNELHPLLQAHMRPLINQSASVASPSAVDTDNEVEELIVNHIPQTKMTGKVEDLAKVYMQWKYMPNPSEIMQDDDMDEENEDEENAAVQGDNELPPPPLPPPPSFTLGQDENDMENGDSPMHSDSSSSPKQSLIEEPVEQVEQHSHEMEQSQKHLPGSLPHPTLGPPLFGGPMLPPLPPPPSLTRPSHFPPNFPLPQGFPGHFLNSPFKHLAQQAQFSHPPEIYQVRSSVPPPPPPPLPSLLPPGVDAPLDPSTFSSSCSNMGGIFDPGPPPLIPLSNHTTPPLVPLSLSQSFPSININLEPLSDDCLLPPGVETEEKPAVPPPPPPPLPPIGLFNMDSSEEHKNSESLSDGKVNDLQDCQPGMELDEENEEETPSIELNKSYDYLSPNEDKHSNNNRKGENSSCKNSPHYVDSTEKETRYCREGKRRKRDSWNIDLKMDRENTESSSPNSDSIKSSQSQSSTSQSSSTSSTSQSSSTSTQNFPTKIVTPNKDLQLVIDRLSLYVVKNGEEFEVGIKEKNDPRFDFLNPWNTYHPYYLNKKRVNLEAVQNKKRKEDERRKNLKVKFDLKTKAKPVSVATQKKATMTASVFNQNDEDDIPDMPAEGFQPNIDPEVEVKRKLQKQIEEKEKLLKQLHEQALLQQKIAEVNRQASIKPMLQNLSPQQQALLKKKVHDKQSNKDNALSAKQDERKKRAATFVGRLKKSTETEESNDAAGNFLRKRHFKETSTASSQEASDRAAYEKKKDAFFKAINDAFKGGT